MSLLCIFPNFCKGISGVTWAADIIKDTMEEGNEKFRVLLKASNNAVLGENDKATVTIVNLNKNGEYDLGIKFTIFREQKRVGGHGKLQRDR